MPLLAHTVVAKEDRRASSRPGFGRPGTIRLPGERSEQMLVVDLTREGCRIVTDRDFTPGCAVEIGLAAVGLTPARLVWRDSRGYGCEFDRPLDPGAITAVFGGSNVAYLPHQDEAPAPPATAAKLAPSTRVGIMVAAAVLAWVPVLAIIAIFAL